MIPNSEDEVVIMDRGGSNPRRVMLAQPSASWELSNYGQFSAFAPLSQLRAAGIPWDMKGMWLEWDSPAGKWGGVITGRPVTDGVAEIASMSYATLLRGRLTPANLRPITAPAGAIAKYLLQEAVRDHPSFITRGVIDEGGMPLDMSFANQDIMSSAIPSLAGNTGHEWVVTPDRVFSFTKYAGEDLSSMVRLVEGRHITTYRVSDDIWLYNNILTGVGANPEIDSLNWTEQVQSRTRVPTTYTYKNKKMKNGKKKRVKVVEKKAHFIWTTTPTERTYPSVDPYITLGTGDQDSIDRYGPLEGTRVYEDTRSMAVIATRIQNELDSMIDQPIALEMTVANVDNCYRTFQEGDVIWVDLGSVRYSGVFRVLLRSIDSGGLRLAGDLRPIRSYD